MATGLENYPEALEMYRTACEHPEAQRDPSPDELLDDWNELYDTSRAQVVNSILGVMRTVEDGHPWALVSVDLCDVVRETARDFMKLGGFPIDAAGETYGYGVPYNIHDKPELVTRIVQGLMITDNVGPVDGIDDIRVILQSYRENGAFVIANTSTLPGCERATLRWMKKYLPDCFDGLVLPRNFDGSGPTTKGTVKIATASEIHQLSGKTDITYTQHIDDAAHHIRAVREASREMGVTSHHDYTPRYIWNSRHDDMNHTDTPLEAFEHAEDEFRKRIAS